MTNKNDDDDDNDQTNKVCTSRRNRHHVSSSLNQGPKNLAKAADEFVGKLKACAKAWIRHKKHSQ